MAERKPSSSGTALSSPSTPPPPLTPRQKHVIAVSHATFELTQIPPRLNHLKELLLENPLTKERADGLINVMNCDNAAEDETTFGYTLEQLLERVQVGERVYVSVYDCAYTGWQCPVFLLC